MAVTAKRGSNSTSSYTVAGKTLAEIVKDMAKKAPVDPNESKRYSGKCLGRLDLKLVDNDLELTVTQGSDPIEVVASLKSGSVSTSCEITVPKLGSDKGLSDNAKKEWKRFLSAVSAHEQGHVDAYFEEAKAVAAELDLLQASATGKTEKAARIAATGAMLKAVQKAFGGTTLDDRMKANAKAYDAKTRHGESQGAALDGSID